MTPNLSDVTLRIHDFIPVSRANGPGLRAVVWFQGCHFHCKGCFNPGTWDTRGGKSASVADVLDWIKDAQATYGIEGVTFSGGEPMLQWYGLGYLAQEIRKLGLTTLLFTGFPWEQIKTWRRKRSHTISRMDVVIAGPYRQSDRIAKGLIGSGNKHIEFLNERYRREDLDAVPLVEVLHSELTGTIRISGIAPEDILADLQAAGVS